MGPDQWSVGSHEAVVAAHGQVGRAAEALRDRLIVGALLPGQRLPEDALSGDLSVSRSTLREAFRLLVHEGLLRHHLNRGVFVAQPGLDDLADLYRVRRLIEPPTVAEFAPSVLERLTPLEEAVTDAETAAGRSHWVDVVTANMVFHERLVALGRSPRLSGTIRSALAETRLAFHAVQDPQPLFEPYVQRNRIVFDGLARGEFPQTADYLSGYLRDSEAALREAFIRDGGWLSRGRG